MPSDRLTWAFVAILGAAVAIVLYGAWHAASDCRAAGGTPVRGMFGVECIRSCDAK